MTRTTPTTIARTAGLIAASAVLIATSACSSSTPSAGGNADASSIGMGIQPWLGYGPWYVAEEKGYFEDAGVDVTITNFMNDADMTAAFAADRIQVANVASHTALQFIEQGLDVSIVLLLDASLQADAILSDGSVTDVADLAGTKIAFEEGSVSNLLLGYALKENGLSLDDITPVPMDPSEAATALLGGSVPVAVTYEPYISEARAADGNFEPIYTAAENEGLISDVLVVDNDYLKDNGDTVQKVVDAWGPSIDYYNSDTDEARGIIAEAIGSDKASLDTAFDGVTYFGLEDNAEELSGHYLTTVLPSVQDIGSEIGILEGGTDLDSIVDPSFVGGSK
ncbi:ABC transporter substrate-binding protein [Mycetocola reblochoni]|uniref:Urea carboxylase-related ABC transporter, periplasmic substrate-binding protein n=2 Tax=Mycetocola reblochoni TaxID=331618 RepID=A0A1R4KAM4_9MICO|nr:ABC transporter substrate-binding protein [Mycetocola reblochoni]RLP71187.1 ABC transporter substrate-binding protein [Mycetocola reblochoni]SJN41192.1 Urea carboxylase-related ABC transporter, periplasmic substrate-binding protein [Mycetocola reblochoni REB411]